MNRGRFITLEGQDGAGKTTNIKTIAEILKRHQIETIITREPGGTELGEALREILLNAQQSPISPKAELFMMFAARAQHIDNVITPALNAGKWVLCDRFTDATYAYQGGGRQLSMHMIAELEQSVQGDLRPDLTILLDLPVDVGQSRAGQRDQVMDRFEQEQQAFKENVRQVYLERAQAFPERIQLIDASQTLNAVNQAVSALIEKFIEAEQEKT